MIDLLEITKSCLHNLKIGIRDSKRIHKPFSNLLLSELIPIAGECFGVDENL